MSVPWIQFSVILILPYLIILFSIFPPQVNFLYFQKNLNVSLCGNGLEGWEYRPFKNVTCESIRITLANFEKSSGRNFPKEARVIPHLAEPDVGECFPNCDDDV